MRSALGGCLLGILLAASAGASSLVVPLHVGHAVGVSYVEFDGAAYQGPASGFLAIAGVQDVFVENGTLLHVAQAQGISALRFDRLTRSYSDASPVNPFFDLPGSRSIDSDPNGILHVLHDAGLSDLAFDEATGYSTSGAFLGLPDPASVVVASSGTIHTGHQAGLSAVSFSPGSYSSPPGQFFPIANVASLAIDGGVIHVGHGAGLSALRYDENTDHYVDSGNFFALSGINTVVADPIAGGLHVGHAAGVSFFTYTAAGGYVPGAFFPLPGPKAIAVDPRGVLHVGHSQGISAIEYDPRTSSYRDTGIFLAIANVSSIGLGPAEAVRRAAPMSSSSMLWLAVTLLLLLGVKTLRASTSRS